MREVVHSESSLAYQFRRYKQAENTEYFFCNGIMSVSVGGGRQREITPVMLRDEIIRFMGPGDLLPDDDGEYIQRVIDHFCHLSKIDAP